MDKKVKEIAIKLLDINQPMEVNSGRHSCIIILLKSARYGSGRDLLTGEYKEPGYNMDGFEEGLFYPHKFSGLISYLIFLEQIGSLFKNASVAENIEIGKEGIDRALLYFGGIDDAEIRNPIIALRNSMAHRFGLATQKKPKSGKPYKFTLEYYDTAKIITPSIKKWDGVFSDKNEDTNTTVHILALVNLIERIYEEVKSKLENDQLDLDIDDGRNELYARYTIV